jgi:hypothetical protein
MPRKVVKKPKTTGGLLPALLAELSASNGKLDIHGFVLREGVAFASDALTDEERDLVNAATGRRTFRVGDCFANARSILDADTSGRLVYVVGYVLDDLAGVIHHGWLALGDKVIDPTLGGGRVIASTGRRPPAGRVYGEFPSSREYYGVRFDRAYVAETLTRRIREVKSPRDGISCTFLDDWEEGYPVVMKGVTGWRHVAKKGAL